MLLQILSSQFLSISADEDVPLTPSEVQEKQGNQTGYFFPALSLFCSWVLKADIGAEAGGQRELGKEGLLGQV